VVRGAEISGIVDWRQQSQRVSRDWSVLTSRSLTHTMSNVKQKIVTVVKNELHANTSPLRVSFSLALGILVGFSPFYGLQTITVIALAFLFRLNRAACAPCHKHHDTAAHSLMDRSRGFIRKADYSLFMVRKTGGMDNSNFSTRQGDRFYHHVY